MSGKFKFDVFVSYSSKDVDRVTSLAERLRKDGVGVWLDRWQIPPGAMIPMRIEEGLDLSRTLLLMMSANSLRSDFVRLERGAILFRDPTNEERRFIPILLEDVEIPDTLKQFAYIDWRNDSDSEYERLVRACKPNEQAFRTLPPQKQLAHKAFSEPIVGLAASEDGSVAITVTPPNVIGVWDVTRGCCVFQENVPSAITAVAISANGKRAFYSLDDASISVWDIATRSRYSSLLGHRGLIRSVAATLDGAIAVSGGTDGTIRLWDAVGSRCVAVFDEHDGDVNCVDVNGDGRRCVHGTSKGVLRVWNTQTKVCEAALSGHTSAISTIALSSDGTTAITGSNDRTLKIWDLNRFRCVATLEGHTDSVNAVCLTSDARLAASSSQDKTIRVWNVAAGECLAVLVGHTAPVVGLAIQTNHKILISGSPDHTVRLWDLTKSKTKDAPPQLPTRYTNAKVLLVGPSGVGKTGLSQRLTADRFEATVSSDGVWATQLKIPYSHSDASEDKEIWLWDFAGQSDYRLIHQLFMDETALAVLVFNPQDENPFESLVQWDAAIKKAAKRTFNKLLVAGRCDRGGAVVSSATIQNFVAENNFHGYLETSAKTGSGCDALRQKIIAAIPWSDIPWTASPRVFRALKDEVLALRDQGYVLIRFVELKQQLELRLSGERFSNDQLRAVIGLLTGVGIVRQLEFGDFVLLRPEYINAYASAVIRTVRSHVDEIGAIHERDVIAGKLRYDDMQRLPPEQEGIVLREMYQMFVDRGLCLRESSDSGELLVFPSYFRRERPDLGQHPSPFITFTVSGALEEIYATLIVRLLHTQVVRKDALWRWAADFRTSADKRVGVKISRKSEVISDLDVYFDPEVSEDIKLTFMSYVYLHLRSKDPDLKYARHFVCPACGEMAADRRAIDQRKQRGLGNVTCAYCDHKIPLHDLVEEKFSSPELRHGARQLELEVRAVMDNESKELILVGHAFSITGEAGQIFRPTANSDWGVDGEIEFKDEFGNATGKRLYLQLKSGDSYLRTRTTDGKKYFRVSNERHLTYWQSHQYPVMLVVRTSDGQIQWMDVSRYLRDRRSDGRDIDFVGEAFTAASLLRVRDKQLSLSGYIEAVAIDAGHRFNQVRVPDWGIDGEIEMLNKSRKRVGLVSLQLRRELAYVKRNSERGGEVYEAAFPGRVASRRPPGKLIMLVERAKDGSVMWMDVTQKVLHRAGPQMFVFDGTKVTVEEMNRVRDLVIASRR